METCHLIVGDEDAGQRVDVFLAGHLDPSCSRSAVKRLIEQGAVTVEGEKVAPRCKVIAGQRIIVERPDPRTAPDLPQPREIFLDVLYEDADIIAVNKPAGMLVHPVHGRGSETLVNALLAHCATLSDLNTAERPGIVHRLDRETSGVILAAKHNEAHFHLAKQFEKHRVRKKYIALVKGKMELNEGVIEAPLARHSRYFDKRAVSFSAPDARPAKTYYRVLVRCGETATVAALFPKTGRTHQLRVHMKYIGHPILGDDKYGNPRSFSRLALHAQAVAFKHPVRRAWMEITAPLPDEFLKMKTPA
ncbi:MAG: RluA family pseudouridine synthase [Candidatus Omnitrophota bacterium]